MITATFSDLRNNARKYFDKVEKGESVEIYRHGKPVAVLAPARPKGGSRWRTASPVTLRGVALSRAILEGRDED